MSYIGVQMEGPLQHFPAFPFKTVMHAFNRRYVQDAMQRLASAATVLRSSSKLIGLLMIDFPISAFIHVEVPVIESSTTVYLVVQLQQHLDFELVFETTLKYCRLTCQSRPYGISSLVDENAGIVVESDQTAIFSLNLLFRPDHNCVSNIPSPHLIRDTQTGRALRLCAERGLLLYYNDDAIA